MVFVAETFADALANTRLNRVPFAKMPDENRPADQPQGYSVQPLLHARLGRAGQGHRAGYKIGCTTKVMQQYLDIAQPCAGGIMANTIHHRFCEAAFDDYCRVGVECEIAVAMAMDLIVEPRQPLKVADVEPYVGEYMAAIEIVDDRYVEYTDMDTPTLIADDFFGAGCVLAKGTMGTRSFNLPEARGRMVINDTEVGSGGGAAILGHPLNALCWLVRFLAGSGQGVKAGEVIMLGSIVQTQWLSRGDHVVVEVEGLGQTQARFA